MTVDVVVVGMADAGAVDFDEHLAALWRIDVEGFDGNGLLLNS